MQTIKPINALPDLLASIMVIIDRCTMIVESSEAISNHKTLKKFLCRELGKFRDYLEDDMLGEERSFGLLLCHLIDLERIEQRLEFEFSNYNEYRSIELSRLFEEVKTTARFARAQIRNLEAD